MCKYVLLTLPHGADVRAIAAQTRWIDPTPVDNASLARSVRLSERAHRATTFSCDCGVPVGASPAAVQARVVREQDLAALRRAGWDERRVAAWVAERVAETERELGHGAWPADPQGEAEKWVEQLRRALSVVRSDRIGIVHHDCRGRLETEGFAPFARRSVAASELSAEHLLGLPADCLLEITA